jgi:maleate isomerase
MSDRRAYVPALARRKIGHITPSSNTVLEPLTACISAEVEDRVSHHFTRIAVEQITLQERHTSQFTPERMLEAGLLLADAGVDAIVWNGTSGGWNGVDADHAICALIQERTGIATSTSTLAQFDAMNALDVKRFALAVPYTDDVTARITEVYGQAGFECVGVANASVSSNREMAYVAPELICDLVRAADSPDADAVLIVCTGIAAAQLVEELEAELGKPVVDSVAVVVWKALQMVGIDPRLRGWGELLEGVAAPSADR